MKSRLHWSARLAIAGGILLLMGLLLACGMGGTSIARSPRWACPSPTPQPFGPAGPVKERIALPTATPSGPQDYREIYFLEWEREYGAGGSLLGPNDLPFGAPFPSPTPYALLGLNYVLGQRVEVWPLHVTVTARGGAIVDRPGVPANTQQLYYVDITWVNHTTAPIPVDYAAQVRVRSVTAPNGAIMTDSHWGLSDATLAAAKVAAPLPDVIPPGESAVSVPIIAPVGVLKTAEITFQGLPEPVLALPVSTALPSTPTPSPTTPTPNTDLRAGALTDIRVTWSQATLRIGPPCGDAGALTNWDNSPGVAWGQDAPLAIPAPPGASRLVQLALNQVGKPYVWGAKGPEQFDCSGLTQWSYAQIGIHIPTGTAGQWPDMHPVSAGELQPGDLIFFDVARDGRSSHVGMLIGDLNGDGAWDMVHAATPQLGVRVEYDVLGSPFWRSRLAGFRTAR